MGEQFCGVDVACLETLAGCHGLRLDPAIHRRPVTRLHSQLQVQGRKIPQLQAGLEFEHQRLEQAALQSWSGMIMKK